MFTQFVYRSRLARIVPLILVLSTVGSVAAQAPVSYRLNWVQLPAAAMGDGNVNQMNNYGVVVGRTYGSLNQGYIYDSLGIYGAPNVLYELSDFIDIPAEWTTSSCVGINDAGLVVGYFSHSSLNSDLTVGFIADLNARTWAYLPQPANCTFAYGVRVNNNGKVLVYYIANGQEFAYLLDPASENQVAMLPVVLTGNLLDLNNAGDVMGPSADGWFRYASDQTLEIIGDTNLKRANAINDFGAIGGHGTRYIRKNSTLTTACVFTDELDFKYLGSERTEASDINNNGDLSVQVNYFRLALHHSGQMFNVDGLLSLNTPQVDRNYWNAARLTNSHLNERDASGFPQLAVGATLTTTTGTGKNKVTTTDGRIFVLTPE